MSMTRYLALLENGDRVSRDEFERRYQQMPNLKKAELIEGKVYMPSPLRFEPHAEPHANIIGWLWNYKLATPGVRLGDNPTVRLDFDNEPQPDAVLLIDANAGGQTRIDEDGYLAGAPEMVIEIAGSSASIDLFEKKQVYRRNGVKEYLVWQVIDRHLDWFYLKNEAYLSLRPNNEGVIRSQVFSGLWLNSSALIAGEMSVVMRTLHSGLASPEHQQFLQQLSRNDRGSQNR